MPDPTPIVLENVSFSYDGTPAVEDVSFAVQEKEFVCMVGPNGGGKTTLLRLILGLLKPERGTVRVFGTTPESARPRVGYMPQRAQLDPKFPTSVLDVVLMGRLTRGFAPGPFRRRDKALATEALGEVGLDALARRSFSDLSGGQRQRVLPARALACQPDLLLLDEPTANLDVVVEGELFELLARLNERLTIVMVSHDIGFVATVVQSVICVNRTVAVHPTSTLNGRLIHELYGSDVSMVRHDHRCSEEGHKWRSS